jgi:hypothetical protein
MQGRMLYRLTLLEDIEAITDTDAMLFSLIKIHDISRADSNLIVFCGHDEAFNCSALGRIAGVGGYGRWGCKWCDQVPRLNGIEDIEDTDNRCGRLHLFHDGRADRNNRCSQRLVRSRLGDFRQWPNNSKLHARLEVFVFSSINDNPISRCDVLPFFERVKDHCERRWYGSDVACTFHDTRMDRRCCRLGCRHEELGSGSTTVGYPNE